MTYTQQHPGGTMTQGLQSLSNRSRIFITNLGKFDITGLYSFMGPCHKCFDHGYVSLFPFSMNGLMLDQDTEAIEKTLREEFVVGEDFLCVTGRGFTNFVIGSVVGRVFSGQTIDLLLYNAKNSSYYAVKWDVP